MRQNSFISWWILEEKHWAKWVASCLNIRACQKNFFQDFSLIGIPIHLKARIPQNIFYSLRATKGMGIQTRLKLAWKKFFWCPIKLLFRCQTKWMDPANPSFGMTLTLQLKWVDWSPIPICYGPFVNQLVHHWSHQVLFKSFVCLCFVS